MISLFHRVAAKSILYAGFAAPKLSGSKSNHLNNSKFSVYPHNYYGFSQNQKNQNEDDIYKSDLIENAKTIQEDHTKNETHHKLHGKNDHESLNLDQFKKAGRKVNNHGVNDVETQGDYHSEDTTKLHEKDTSFESPYKNKIEFFQEFSEKHNFDERVFEYFKLKDVRDNYKTDHQILSFMLEDKIIARFRDSFDSVSKYKKLFKSYFELPIHERELLIVKEFGVYNVQKYLNFYPLYTIFILYAKTHLKAQFQQSIKICQKLLLESPLNLYPESRKLKKKIIYHYGPTNSGKTHAAITELMKSSSGIYCGPLRLLATEIYQKFKDAGLSCNLITGQEKIYEEDSRFYSCTVEIGCQKTNILFDCAVIDEIQYLGDPERGGAWTKSLLGLQAKVIHVCGDGRAINLVKAICKETGDEFETIEYKRMSTLRVLNKEYQCFEDLQEGDCFVTFSVEGTMSFKQKINNYMNTKLGKTGENYCSIIYGRQPPEIKKMQSEFFNTRVTKYLVATNAIGLGLNLNIQRIIFTSFTKTLKSHHHKIDMHEILQIAGRAGRYKEDGIVCARHANQIGLLRKVLSKRDHLAKDQDLKKAAFFPTFEQIEEFSTWMNENIKKKKPLSEIFSNFANYSTCQGTYFIENEMEFCQKADLTENLGLSLQDQFHFSQAPMRMGKHFEKERQLFQLFASKYAQGLEVELPGILCDSEKLEAIKDNSEVAKDALDIYESLYYILELYIWLGNKFGETSFPDTVKAQGFKKNICRHMNNLHQQNQYY